MSYIDIQYKSYQKKDFVYNNNLEPIETSDLELEIPIKHPHANNITSDFYEGFGCCN